MELPAIETQLRDVARRATSLRDPAGLVVIAIQLGGAPIGSLAIMDAGLSDTVLHSIANLAAIGLERARSQEATARAEAAQQSSELRATVLDALAHEFKTPLTSMKAAASDLLASASTSARDRELVTIIDEDLDRFQALVTDAVQMLRIDAGNFAVHLDRHNLADVVATTLRKFETPSRWSPALSSSVPERPDGRRRSRVARTGASTAARQRAEVLAADIDHRDRGAGQRSGGDRRPQFRFDDSGARAGAASSNASIAAHKPRHVPGTGMGLAIVQQIARAHGGTLTISSSPDAGTAFTLSLPRERTRIMSAGRILVVDDDPQIRRVMRVTLTGQGYEVDDAKSGEAALEKLRDERFDLVLLDMNMPGMGGLETCRAIRGQSEIAIIMLTVRDSEVRQGRSARCRCRRLRHEAVQRAGAAGADSGGACGGRRGRRGRADA